MIKKKDIWSRLFEPNSKLYPDLTQRQLQARKNRQYFLVFLGCDVLYILSIPLSDFSNETHFAILGLHLLYTSLFLLLCRSYMALFHVLYTLCISFVPFPLMAYTKETFFLYLGHAFTIPPFIFMVSQSISLATFAGSMQVIIFHTKYKYEFAYHLQALGPNIFAEKFVKGMTTPFIFLLVVYILGLRLLHNKTIELFHANKVAEDALDQQKTFILSFSHELRNPLNSLLGNLQLVLMAKLPVECIDMIKTAKVCGELLLQYINNLLDTGKLEVGNLEVSPALINVHDLFQRAWTISNEIIYRKNLVGHLKIEKQVPSQLLLDSQRITQILLNLIGNAVKFTETGSITTTIQWLECDSVCEQCFEPIPYDDTDEGLFEKQENVFNLTSRYLLLTKHRKKFNLDEVLLPETSSQGILKIIIKDTGCGMRSEALKLLFQKFSQVSDDVLKRQVGTGLGLFITREICRKMKGEVRVYSKEKVGTTFIVCIPTLSVPIKKEQIYSLPTVFATLKERKKRAIVVDDSPFNVNLLSSYFQKIGVEVIATANNGHDALKRYINLQEKGVPVDIITLDIDMPKMNGKIAFKKMRQFEEDYNKPKATVVMISGNYDERQLKDSLGPWRVDYFFKKPLLFEDFMTVIYELLVQT